MFELQPSQEFSTWFEALAAEHAEEVACALEVVAEAGPVLARDRVSRALLWFDGTQGEPVQSFGRSLEFAEWARELMLFRGEAMGVLESEAFRERLACLEAGAARDALLLVERLKRGLSATRTQVNLASAGSFNSGALREHFFELLRRVGLEPSALAPPNGLCELTITTTLPKLRVLFGVHAEARRLWLILGEPLTRSYYGDSVRFAERRWREYCAREAPALLIR